MGVTVKSLIGPKYAENASTLQYTAVGVKCVIDSFAVVNGTSNNVTFSAYLVPSGGAPAASNLLVSKTIFPGEHYPCPALIGKALESGGMIYTNCGTASALVMDAAGREIS